MLKAGLSVVSANGKLYIQELLDLFDKHLSQPSQAKETHDRIRESLVILMGTLAQYLDDQETRIMETVEKLIDTLKTPSELYKYLYLIVFLHGFQLTKRKYLNLYPAC